jgi:PA14 domain
MPGYTHEWEKTIGNSMQKNVRNIVGLIGSIGLLMSASSALAGSATWDFTTDPTTGANPIEIYPTGFLDSTGTSINWMATGGDPGGFLGLTWPLGGSSTIVLFPDIDNGKTVTAFEFECDLRIGNPQQSDRAADGFSINFARNNDPVFANHATSDFATSGAVETGTTTGVAISFDTWSGNALPDGADIEGIIVRVDNKTVLRQSVPTRNGACDDVTSLQTGPRDLPYWQAAAASATPLPDAAFQPDSWKGLCWQHLKVTLDDSSKLTVVWKGATILDHFQTEFFPSGGGIVLAGRTGGADEHTHFDNIKLTTTALTVDTQAPTAPAGLQAAEVGTARVALNWTAATDNSGRVAYELEKDGTMLTAVITETNYVDKAVLPGSSHTYKVRATDVSGNKSPFTAPLTITTAAEVASVGVLKAEIFDGISGTTVDLLLADANFTANTPSRVTYIPGLSAGNPNGNAGWNESFGDNYGMRITGTLIPSETASYDFFIRSDDASQFYLNETGASIPNLATASATIEETGCCSAFLEPGDAAKPTVTTASPIALTAGKTYGFVVLMKEGGGGDGVGVAWRKVGDTTPAANLPMIGGAVLAGKQDAVGASVTITQAPKDTTVIANEKVSLSVAATTKSPYSTAVAYQWYKNGAIIPSATAATYTIPVASTTDNGAKFKAMVIAVGAQTTSTEATLTVNADTKLPVITAVNGDETLTKVTIGFSEPVKAPSATTAANYKLDNGGTVSAAALLDQYTVQLTTAKLTEKTVYTLTVNNVQDNAGNAIAANSMFKFQSWGLVANRAKWEQWTGIGGTSVQSLLDDPKWTGNAAPDAVRYMPGMNTGADIADNFGATLKAYLIPTETADYDFFIRSDDASQLFLSQTETFPVPGTDTPIAEETGCCKGFLEPGNTTEASVTTATPIALTAGKKYALLAVYKEGGGGDFVQVAWRKVGDTTAAGSLTPLSANVYWLGPAPATNVLAVGDIIGASSGNTPTSGNENAKGVLDGVSTTKYLNFDKLNTGFTVKPQSGATVVTGITLTTANDAPERDPASFIVQGSLDGVTFTTLTTNSMSAVTNRFYSRTFTFANTMPYTVYKVIFPTVANDVKANSMQIADVALLGNGYGGTLPAPVIAPTAEVAGFAKIEFFDGIGGTVVNNLIASAKFNMNQPDRIMGNTSFQTPSWENGTDYGGRLTALMTAPASGDYTFYVSSDDASKLFLSTDENPVNVMTATPIAAVSSWTNQREWTKEAGQKSTPVTLVAGKKYHVTALWKEGGGGDGVAVGWTQPGEAATVINVIPGSALSTFINPEVSSISIVAQPTAVTVAQNRPATFTASATGSSTVGSTVIYQWQRNGVDIAGANGASYTLPALAALSDNGSKFRVVFSVPGKSVISDEVVLTVNADTTAPSIASAGGLATSVGVMFNELIDKSSAELGASYTVTGAAVTKAELRADGMLVVLTLDKAVAAGATVTVNGVKDLAMNNLASGSAPIAVSDLTSMDIGTKDATGALTDPIQPGASHPFSANQYEVIAGGSDIWNNADGFHFTYKQLAGEFEVVTRVSSLQYVSDNWAKAGLMIRETLDGDSRNVNAVVDPTRGANIWEGNFRDVKAGGTAGFDTGTRPGPVTYPNAWIKLVRETVATNAISFYYSVNGVDWTLRGVKGFTSANAYPDKVYVGMVATAHNNTLGTNTVAVFNDFKITPMGTGGQPEFTSIVKNANGTITLTWTGGGTLQMSTTVTGPYTDVAGATSPFTVTPPSAVMFGRIRK